MNSQYPSALKSILAQKCPQCRSEKLFTHPTYSTSFLKMHKTCPNCKLDLVPEPGFYWSAMYITYAFNTALAIVCSVIIWLLFNPELWVYITIVLTINILISPVFFRYSRLITLYTLGGVKFKPSTFKNK